MDDDVTRVAITGAAGRMGRRLIAVGHETAGIQITAAVERGDSTSIGTDAGELAGVGTIGVAVGTELDLSASQVVIDFTAPVAMRNFLQSCREAKTAMVIGTTGLTPDDHRLIDAAARDIAVLQAGNMSLGVTVLCRLVEQAAEMLGDDFDVEVVEMHHRYKKDAPSGTAEMIAGSAATALSRSEKDYQFGRHGGNVPRTPKEIGLHSLRAGDEVGTHTAYFGGLGERLELTHKATNRDTFVHGALRAARWLATRPPGRYTISDVLGLA